MKKTMTKATALILGSLLTLSSLSAQEIQRTKSLDPLMYSINSNASLSGPIFPDTGTEEEKSKYMTEILKLIIKRADINAKKYYEAKDYRGYYTFLTLAIAVPMHEGLLIHFRKSEADACKISHNNGGLLKRYNNNTAYNVFLKYFKDFKNSKNSFFPTCESLKNEDLITQIIHGADGADISMMQVSLRWHYDDYVALKKYLSVEDTIEYGQDILLTGFDQVYRNASRYSCIYNQEKRRIDRLNIIKGVWSGKYNSGSLNNTCRFMNKESKYAQNDIAFRRDLVSLFNTDKEINLSYVGKIKLEEQTSAAIAEILSNFKNGKNNRVALDSFLNENLEKDTNDNNIEEDKADIEDLKTNDLDK